MIKPMLYRQVLQALSQVLPQPSSVIRMSSATTGPDSTMLTSRSNSESAAGVSGLHVSESTHVATLSSVVRQVMGGRESLLANVVTLAAVVLLSAGAGLGLRARLCRVHPALHHRLVAHRYAAVAKYAQ